jgi:cell division septation protein DedD
MVPLLLAAKKPPPPPPEPAASVKLGVEKWRVGDYDAAVALWTPFAQAGDTDALFNLGQAYKLGRGVPQDLARARDYYAAAAAKGSVPGQANLGIMLFQAGEKPEALRWLKMAADRGEPRAQYVLGVATFNGDGIRRSKPLGYAYLLRASASGLAQARTTLAAIEPTLNPVDRSSGEAIAASLAAGSGVPAAFASSAPQTITNPIPARVPPPPVAPLPQAAPPVQPKPQVVLPPPVTLPAVVPAPAVKPQPVPIIPPAKPPVPVVVPAPVAVPPPAVVIPPKPRPLQPPVAKVDIPASAPVVEPARPVAAPAAKPVVPPPAAPPVPEKVAPAKPDKPVAKAETAKAAPAKAPAKAETPKPAAKPVPKGWRVQLGAFSNAAKAEAAWAATRKAVSDLPGSGKPIYDAGDSIVKLQLGPFSSKAEAQTACAQLSAAGRACFTVAP